MRKLIGLFLFVFLVFSCRDPLLDSLPRFMREQDRFAREAREGGGQRDSLLPDTPREPEVPPEPEYIPSVYATAIHFRDSVDWRKDSLGKADLLFFKDGGQVLHIPVETPPDPERHRVWDGHLWSDATDGHQTVVLCDGQERFRFDGEEHLQGFLLVNGDVHTLGQHPGRDGFCYRINGNAVFDSPRGSVLGSPSDPEWRGGALVLDGEDVFYCYKDRDYYVMRGGEPFRTLPAGSSNALLDLRVSGQTLHRIERRGSDLFWMEGEQERLLKVYTPTVISCKLIPYGDSLTVRGRTASSSSNCLNWYFNPATGVITPLSSGQSTRGQAVLTKENWLFADLDADGRVLKLNQARKQLLLPDGDYRLATPLDLFVSAEHCAAALTSAGSRTHVVLSDLGQQSYYFNGYFTSVRIE